MEEYFKEVNKKEIAELLGKSYNTVRHWTEDRLVSELLANCWEVIEANTIGKSKIYTLKYVENDIDIILFLECEFNVKNGEKFAKYLKIRLQKYKGGIPMSKKQIGEKVGVGRKTVGAWDKKILNCGLISPDGYVFIRATGVGTTFKQELVSEEEYINWYTNEGAKHKARVALVNDNNIALSERDKFFLSDTLRMSSDVWYYKIRKFLIMEDSPYYDLISKHLLIE